MGKSRLGRMRKYSHRKYRSNANSCVSSPDGVKPIPVHSCGIPIKFQFALRNVPKAVMHQSSLYSYSCVFTSLSDDGVLNSNWNVIKHSELFLMLCTCICWQCNCSREDCDYQPRFLMEGSSRKQRRQGVHG